ncbi:MAG: hypothetical protein Q7K13_04775 [Polynucleobacter sp.]|uniref:hypothetical protein n=1 Tax=Polynucleobacter sp. TaxID=2029855 RepID=UPI0027248D91|nr:hypothetical protein [Polynucleobacter sp.]MDO8713777.1 hypothetical protein [Polynucleobacter sp.]
MNAPQIEAQQRIADAAKTKADVLSLKLYNLIKAVKLAAFAADMRRTLEGIDDATHFRPEMREIINEAAPYSRNWLEMEDPTSEVLLDLASQIETINSEFTETVYDLAQAKTGSTEAKKNGGAA